MKHIILLVDDDKDILSLMKESLEDLSFEVIAVDSAQSAVEKINSHTIDCLVTDISMPEMNGVELAQVYRRKLGDSAPLFFITAYMDYSREELNAYNPNAIMFKPFDFEEAAILIKNYFLRKT